MPTLIRQFFAVITGQARTGNQCEEQRRIFGIATPECMRAGRTEAGRSGADSYPSVKDANFTSFAGADASALFGAVAYVLFRLVACVLLGADPVFGRPALRAFGRPGGLPHVAIRF